MGAKLKEDVEQALAAFRGYQKAVQPLFERAMVSNPIVGKKHLQALNEIAIEFADSGELAYHLASLDKIARERGFKDWQHLLLFSGTEYAGLKEVLKDDIRWKEKVGEKSPAR